MNLWKIAKNAKFYLCDHHYRAYSLLFNEWIWPMKVQNIVTIWRWLKKRCVLLTVVSTPNNLNATAYTGRVRYQTLNPKPWTTSPEPQRACVDAVALRGIYRPLDKFGQSLSECLINLSPEIYGSINNPRVVAIRGLEDTSDRLPRGHRKMQPHHFNLRNLKPSARN